MLETPPPRTITSGSKISTTFANAKPKFSRNIFFQVSKFELSKFLVISGKPINEEIARGGPFVMNTKAEILQAVQDYHNGTFVK